MKLKRLLRNLPILVGMILLPFIIVWVFGPLIKAIVKFVSDHGLNPLDVEALPEWLSLPLTVLIFMSPLIAVAIALIFLTNREPDKPQDQLRRLAAAKESLTSSLAFLDDVQAEIQSRSKRYEELSALVSSLEATSKESSSQLKQKLDAISYANRRTETLKLLASFVLGVIASLIASAIWSMMSR